ncbi:MAG: glycosyltransferase family 2 protein [Candidatus Omnitrophica bacterium]|nr:glycosyltransferase family 2 protein [Candidatus Omnitrophota bacterium]
MKKINVVVPIYNEHEVLPELISRLQKVTSQCKEYDFSFIMVENGSVDNSLAILKEKKKDDNRIKILKLSRNFGCDGGITAGLKYADADAVIVMNADLQDPPELILEFTKKWEQGFDVVYGKIKKRVGGNFIRNMCSSLFYFIINSLTGGTFPRNVSDFRLMDKKVVKVINSMPENNRFIRGIVAWTGFKQSGIEFERPDRFAGKPKAGFLEVYRTALNGIFSFSYFPLKITTFIGVFMSLVSFVIMLLFITLFFVHGREVPGHSSVIVTMTFLFGMLFFILGVIGEYIARIYDETKNRPNFIVDEEIF